MAAKVKAIETFPRPRTVQNLQTFLGMANFYRWFLLAAARTLRPLTDAVRGSQSTVLAWTEPMQAAFAAVKKGLCQAVELAHPAPAAEVFLAVDASGQTARPLAFFSAKLEPAQQKYSAFDRELLACYLAIRHFRWMLEGRKFYVLTDHKAADLCAAQSVRRVVGQAAAPALLYCGIYVRFAPRGGSG
jgi:predicted lipid-binding transport protein (Tim44 family)